MRSQISQPFDFDAWMALARDDPDGFERRRRETIERYIESVSEDRRARLYRLQWRVDMERRRHRNPQSASAHLFAMMWERVYGEDGLLQALQSFAGGTAELAPSSTPAPKKTAQVLQFPSPAAVNS